MTSTDPERPNLAVKSSPTARPALTSDDVVRTYGVDLGSVDEPDASSLLAAVERIRRATRGEAVDGVAVEVRSEGTVTVTARSADHHGTCELVSKLDLSTGVVRRTLTYESIDGNTIEHTTEHAAPETD